MVWTDSDRDHVLFDELAEVNSRIEALRDNVPSLIVGCDVEHDLRKFLVQPSQLWNKHGRHRKSWYQQTHPPYGSVCLSRDLIQGLFYFAESGLKAGQETFAGLGERDAPCRPGK